jgi:two-component system sensor histidine kinase PilS (NtrC family)
MIDPFKTDLEQGRLVLKRFALARAMIVSLVALLCLALHLRSGAESDQYTYYLFAIFAIALIESLIVMVILAAGYNPSIRFSFFLLCADLILISAIVVVTGGSKSVFAFLYIAAILSAAIVLSFNWSILVATICSALFLLIMLLELSGYVVPASAFRWTEPPMVSGDLWAYTGMKIFAFYLTAFLAGCLSRRVGLLESFQQNILNSFSSGFMSVNRDCIVTFLNPAGSNLLRRPWSEAAGKHVSSVFPVADGQPNPLEESIAEQKEYQNREIAVSRGDDESIPVGITVSPIRNGAKKLMGAVASFIDLTELKRMEERLRRSDRLAAVGEMSAVLAHEIRNPVASIRGAVQELAENLRLDGTNGQLIRIATRECDQLNRIVSDFLEFVGTGPRAKEQCDVRRILDEVGQLAERCFCNGDISILKQYPDGLGCVTGDCNQIREALLNIVQNGIEAMPAGGTLRIRAGSDDSPPGYASILVEDDGCGLAPEEVERIFDPFYTTKPRGVGLGMAIAHRIVTSHGGSIDVDSAKGKGTTVTIVLPRQD